MKADFTMNSDTVTTENQHIPEGCIGVFDSGLGGISVLSELKKELPEENYLYYGDSANAPYGEKFIDEIRSLTLESVDFLVSCGIRALVIACNTATSAAVSLVRSRYDSAMPVIGVEPAIRPAAEAFPHGKILVMATPATLKLEKYARLSRELAGEAEFIPVMCPGLAGRIEQGRLDDPDLTEMLTKFLSPYIDSADAIVLGCTHYPFIKKQIRRVMGDIPLFDGGAGTARQLHRRLLQRGLLAESASQKTELTEPDSQKEELTEPDSQKAEESRKASAGQVIFLSSRNTPEEISLYREMFETFS